VIGHGLARYRVFSGERSAVGRTAERLEDLGQLSFRGDDLGVFLGELQAVDPQRFPNEPPGEGPFV
jgi:hypothetical protein